MSHLWQAWVGADGSRKGNGLGLVLSIEVVRSSRAAEGGTWAALASGISLGMG